MKLIKRILSLTLILSLLSTLYVISPVTQVSAAGGENIAVLGTAFDDGSDSYYDVAGTYLGGVNDGDLLTAWQYAFVPEDEESIQSWQEGIYVGINFDAPYNIGSVYILVEEPSRYAYGGMVLEYTDDGVTWQEVPNAQYFYGYATGIQDYFYDEILFDPVLALGIRVVMYEGTSKWCPRIAEIEVYEAGDSTFPGVDWSPNPDNFAPEGTAFDDGSDGYYAAPEVFLQGVNDGDYLTSWQYQTQGDVEIEEILSWPNGIHVGVKFNAPRALNKVSILVEDSARYAPESMVVEYSPDRVNWYPVENSVGEYYAYSGIDGWTYDHIVFDEVNAAGIRIVIYEATSKWSPKIAEIEVYSNGDIPVIPPEATEWQPNIYSISAYGTAFDDGSFPQGFGGKIDGLNDNDINTAWQYNKAGVNSNDILSWEDGIYAGIMFNEIHTVSYVGILVESASRYLADTMKIQYSTDYFTWNDLEYVLMTDIESGASGWVYDVAVCTPVEAVAIRVLMYDGTGQWSPKIAEIEICEELFSAPAPTLTLMPDSGYTLDMENLYVLGIPVGTTVGDFKSNFVEDIILADNEDAVLADSDFVGTGKWIAVNAGESYEYTLIETVVSGDINGDGKINSTDFMQVRRSFLGLYEFDMYSKNLAADVNSDGKINSTDFMQIRRHFLGLFNLFA